MQQDVRGKRTAKCLCNKCDRAITCMFCPDLHLTYPVSRGYIFAVWAVVRKVASADNHSIFYLGCTKFVARFTSKINRQVCHQMAQVWGNKKIVFTLICYTRFTQDSHNALNRSRTGKNPFFYLFVPISRRIWTVVGRGYFSHASSHSKEVASARRVHLTLLCSCVIQKFFVKEGEVWWKFFQT